MTTHEDLATKHTTTTLASAIAARLVHEGKTDLARRLLALLSEEIGAMPPGIFGSSEQSADDIAALARIPGIGAKTAETLAASGYSLDRLRSAKEEELATLAGIGSVQAAAILRAVQEAGFISPTPPNEG